MTLELLQISAGLGNGSRLMGNPEENAELYRRAEERSRFLASLHQALLPVTDPDEAVLLSAQMLGEHLKVDRCAYAEVAADQDAFYIPADYTRPGTASIAGNYTFSGFGAEVLRLMRAGEPYVVSDIDNDPRRPEDMTPYRITGIIAVICVSLLKAGRFVAAMAVHQHTPRVWTEDEVDLVQTVANRCWESIERARVTRSLVESEEKFRAIADNISQLAWMTDASGFAVWYNQRWYEYTGATPGETDGFGWQDIFHPDYFHKVSEKFFRSIAAGQPWEDTFPLRGADGQYRWFLSRAMPIRDAAGNVTRWFGTNTDITQRLETEKALREREERLAEVNAQLAAARDEALAASAAKSTFLATMSHELRTPLNAIIGYAEMLREDAEYACANPVELSADLQRIRSSGLHLLDLISAILDFSKIEAGRMELARVELDLAQLVDEATALVGPQAAANGNRIESSLDHCAEAMLGDPIRLKQILLNLLSNSAKFTHGGLITINCKRDDSPEVPELTIVVRDTGSGIPPEHLPLLFESFRQLDTSPTRRHGGTGLGLAITKRLVEAMGGTISVQTEVGKGTQFRIKLPTR